MMVGDVVEAILKGVIKEANLEGYKSSQNLTTKIGKHTVTGEADLSFDEGRIDDIKSTSDYLFYYRKPISFVSSAFLLSQHT